VKLALRAHDGRARLTPFLLEVMRLLGPCIYVGRVGRPCSRDRVCELGSRRSKLC
jgi:hypothetical protein